MPSEHLEHPLGHVFQKNSTLASMPSPSSLAPVLGIWRIGLRRCGAFLQEEVIEVEPSADKAEAAEDVDEEGHGDEESTPGACAARKCREYTRRQKRERKLINVNDYILNDSGTPILIDPTKFAKDFQNAKAGILTPAQTFHTKPSDVAETLAAATLAEATGGDTVSERKLLLLLPLPLLIVKN